MKNIRVVLLILLTASIGFANNNVQLKSDIDQITVFTNGAEITRSVKASLDKGITELIITDLEKSIDNNSLQVSAKGNVTILSVNQRTNFLKESERPDRIIGLEKELETLKDKLNFEISENEVIEAEIDLILSNKLIGSEQQGVKVSELKKMAEYYNNRLLKLKVDLHKKSKVIKKLEEEIDKINRQIGELIGKFKEPVNEVVVRVSAEKKAEVKVNLSYLISNAGWNPSYDLRAESINADITLSYKADIWQNSDIDWENVSLKLSTRNPRENNNKPVLYPWYLNFAEPMPMPSMRSKYDRMEKKLNAVAYEAEVTDAAGSMAQFINVNQKQLSVEFVPSLKVSIPSDGKRHNIALADKTLEARFEYYTAPKLREAAYLIAYIKEFESSDILPGSANIYFENSFVGKVFINPRNFDEEFAVSFGKDNSIFVKRTQISDYTETKFLSSDIERKFAYEIEIKNNKNDKIDIVVEDNLPISQHEDIEVELVEKSNAEFDKSTGNLQWKLTLDADNTVKQKLIYTVKYPKDKKIDNL